MTMEANLVEGVKIGFMLGALFGIVLMLVLAWSVSYFGYDTDDH